MSISQRDLLQMNLGQYFIEGVDVNDEARKYMLISDHGIVGYTEITDKMFLVVRHERCLLNFTARADVVRQRRMHCPYRVCSR